MEMANKQQGNVRLIVDILVYVCPQGTRLGINRGNKVIWVPFGNFVSFVIYDKWIKLPGVELMKSVYET